MINIEQLLSPISPDEPCGPDLAYDRATQELETLLHGKPETQFSSAEEPRWEDVRDSALELLSRSKNLRVAVILCLALLRTDGIPGFRDGITVIDGLLRQYWDTLYPRLDPEDNNDPTERVNILASLVTPLGSFDDPMQFLRRLREAKLTDSPLAGRFSLEEISPSQAPGTEGALPGVDSKQVQAAFKDTGAEKIARVTTALSEATKTAKSLDEYLTDTIGAGRAPDWSPLLTTLIDIRKGIAPFVATSDIPVSMESISTGSESTAAALSVPSAPGVIGSRADVVQTLERICDYYASAEPSSPVPLLLRRAQRLATMNFLEIIGELSPDALGPVQFATGIKPPDAIPEET